MAYDNLNRFESLVLALVRCWMWLRLPGRWMLIGRLVRGYSLHGPAVDLLGQYPHPVSIELLKDAYHNRHAIFDPTRPVRALVDMAERASDVEIAEIVLRQ